MSEGESTAPPAAPQPAVVVGIGVSTSSADALLALFATMPRQSGASFVIVSEAGRPADPAALVAALNARPGPPARLAADGMLLLPDQVLVVPPDAIASLEQGRLHLVAPEQRPGHRGTIDTFLISLAEQQREAAVAVMLATLGEQDSIGVARVKSCGGLVLAEQPAGTSPPDPGEIDGAAGMADLHIPLPEVPLRLLAHIRHLRELDLAQEDVQVLQQGESRLPAIATILRNRTGHDFHGYKANTFLRRIQRRMHVLRLDDLDDYVVRLRGDADEAQSLFQDLLIGVTQFFRDPGEFALLEQQVIPQLLQSKSLADTLRVWVLGCATGEEAYSLAMLLREAMAQVDAPPLVQIFATDIDARALAVARAGRYPQAIEKDVPEERLTRWFVKEGGTYAIHKDLREMCIFSAHNVIKDAPFSRIDLISCRNLLIYLNSDLQDRVIPLFHFSLRPGGYLFLGPSENVTRHAQLFQPLDRRHRVFRRQESAAGILPEFPLSTRPETRRGSGDMALPARITPVGMLGKRAERVVERYAPAYVVADADYQVLNFSGRTGPFLDPSSGVANLNLLNLVHRDLRLDLRAALMRVASERKPFRVAPLRMGAEGEARRVGLSVEPLVEDPQDAPNFVVLFHDYGPESGTDAEDVLRDPAVLRDEHVLRLESELRLTKDRLQATIEELESTNEELKSSNEEYQSINEELQSANEELETSKEELQSVNEELQTVNGELAHRVGELARINSDLKNLLESTQIATLFLDNDLRVKSFTPSMSEVFHLIDTDLGRPIAHIAARVPYPDMDADLRRVLRTLSTIEREIGESSGRRYLVRVLPYRSVNNFIAGAVLTFLDITVAARAQEALRVAEERARLATAAAHIITWELDLATGNFAHADGFEQTFGLRPPITLAALLKVTHADDRETLSLAFDRAIEQGEALDVEARLMTTRGDLWLRFSGARSAGHLLGVFQDVDERRRAQAQQSLLLAELQHRVKNILAVVRSITRRSLDSAESLEELRSNFAGRIDALARTQSVLANRADEGVRLDELVRDELAAAQGQGGGSVEIEGPPILLKDKAAEIFGLALHELTTNSTKYGALAQAGGRLSLRWQVMQTSSGQRLALEWRESGVPDLQGEPARSGFGRNLIERGLPYDLDAVTALEFMPGGLRCTVELPLGPRVQRIGPADS